MSAVQLAVHWTMRRAIYALTYQGDAAVDLDAYAKLFDLDLADTIALFESAAQSLGREFRIDGSPPVVLH